MSLGGGPRVTLGVPVYNGERHLAEALDALLAQDFEDFELLIADNGSTDGTAAIARDYAATDSRVRVLPSAVNQGAAWNYNRLVRAARGEYFKWAADDDVVSSDYVSRCVSTLDERPDVVLAYGRTVLIDDAGATVGVHPDGTHLPQDESWQRLGTFATQRWLCNACFGVARRSVMLQDTTLIGRASSDVTYLAQLALAGKIWEVPGATFYRRLDPESASLGGGTRVAVAAFFAPGRSVPLVSPMTRVFLDIERWIITRHHLTLSERARSASTFGLAWSRRQAGIRLWKVRRALKGGPVGFINTVQPAPAGQGVTAEGRST